MSADQTIGSTVIAAIRGPLGDWYVAADSVADLLHSLASKMNETTARELRTIAAAFATMDAIGDQARDDDDESFLTARECSCGAPVIDATFVLTDASVTVDANPVPDGELYAMAVTGGKAQVARSEPKFDGIDLIRLHEHTCAASSG